MAAYIFTILWGIIRPSVCFKYSPKIRRALGPWLTVRKLTEIYQHRCSDRNVHRAFRLWKVEKKWQGFIKTSVVHKLLGSALNASSVFVPTPDLGRWWKVMIKEVRWVGGWPFSCAFRICACFWPSLMKNEVGQGERSKDQLVDPDQSYIVLDELSTSSSNCWLWCEHKEARRFTRQRK